jgi:Arc/MetJ family transcription regulator
MSSPSVRAFFCWTVSPERRNTSHQASGALSLLKRTLKAACGPYQYGIIVWMKKTLHIDETLLREAKSACGAKTDTDTVRLGLEALVRHRAYERLRALRGSEPHARETPRRRESAARVKHSAA